MYLNFKRKSTVGWNIINILLDLTGGIFSFLQIAIDAINGEGSLFGGGGAFNVVKFILSVTSIFFDSIFIFQHYVLYRHSWKNDELYKVIIGV